MRLDTVTKIESFMADALLSSPQIPLGVNIVRVAATEDEEGFTHLARSIMIRYTGSSLSLEQTQPMSIYRRMSFEVTLAAQSYLTNTGHDYVIQMCAGSYNTLVNQVPSNTGSQIVEPFHMTTESFEGISNSTHYIYVQKWELTVQEIQPLIALDPCVAKGNCSYLFPQDTISTIMPGDVVYKNFLFSPILPPAPGQDFDPDFCGVVEEGDNLVYKYDSDKVFLTDWMTYTLVSTDKFDESGEMLLVRIYDSNGDLYDTTYFSNCDNRKVIQIAGTSPYLSPNQLGGLGRSGIDNAGNPLDSNLEALPAVMAPKNGMGYVNVLRGTLFSDPTDANAATVTVRYGALFNTQEGVTLTHDSVVYQYIGGTPLGKAWVRQDDFTILKPAYVEPALDCDDPTIEEGDSQGSDGNGSGPLP